LLSESLHFQDLFFGAQGFGTAPYLLAAQTSQNTGLNQLATEYAHRALTYHKNPLQTCYIYTKLGAMAVENSEKEEESTADLAKQ
jgi:hypothetical protein